MQVPEQTLREAHGNESKLAKLNQSIDKENKRLILENITFKNTERYEKHAKLSFGASLIELDQSLIPNDARGISKAYAKFKKASHDAHYPHFGQTNVEKFLEIHILFNLLFIF